MFWHWLLTINVVPSCVVFWLPSHTHTHTCPSTALLCHHFRYPSPLGCPTTVRPPAAARRPLCLPATRLDAAPAPARGSPRFSEHWVSREVGSGMLGVGEVLRRLNWNLFKLEAEQLHNMERFR